ncbi:MAG: hypothetical protein ACJASX_000557 [Limisphaerales bacterium]|jgi:hypothetical protein
MSTPDDHTDALSAFNQVAIPDLWQQKAVTHLREGKDVVVHAPTGAGKTLIFELWANDGRPTGQAIYTVPTRALANDKLGEWRRRGWNVGIATGDLSDNLDAPIIVATLETQKNLGEGDIDRAIIEWRSLLRQTANAPELDWPRWMELRSRAAQILDETESPTLTDLPDLPYDQTRKVEHSLRFKRR